MVQKNSAALAAPRGRPRSFDTDEVLGRVRDTFWRYGYAGTSMDQLAAATGLHKPSLYGAFGDKKQLYRAALDNYMADIRAEFAEAFAIPDLFESLKAMAKWSVDKFAGEKGCAPGCFMMQTAIPAAAEDPELAELVRKSIDSLDAAVEQRFEKAIADGQLPPSADPRALAMIMVANHYEISGRARAGYGRPELEALADRALALVKLMSGVEQAA